MSRKTQLPVLKEPIAGGGEPVQPEARKEEARPVVQLEPIQLYLQQISRFPILTKEDELRLSREFYKTKQPELAKLLAQSNLRFVVKIAAEYTRFGARLIDLVQEGNIGLLQAIKEFNPYKGVRLITYAVWWIRGYIQEYLMRQYSLVRIGTNAKQKKLFYLLKKQQEQLQRLSQEEGLRLIAHFGDFKKQEVQTMQKRLAKRDLSLDQPLSEQNTSLLDQQNVVIEDSLEEQLDFQQQKSLMYKSLDRLKPLLNKKEIFILEHRLLASEPLTLREIGQKFSITREAVRQIESKLIQKIREALKKFSS